MLLWAPDHRHRILALISAATRIVIGTGNLGTGDVVKAIGARAKAGVPVAITTGCGGGTTHQYEVTRLREECGAQVRVVDDRSGGLFHAKVYAFSLPEGDRALVGSANLSGAGFGQNREVMVEVELQSGELNEIASRLAGAGPELADLSQLPWLRPPGPGPKSDPKERIGLGAVLEMNWSSFVDAVWTMHRWWRKRARPRLNVMNGTPGWVDTLQRLEVLATTPIAEMSITDRRTLVGCRNVGDGRTDVAFLGGFDRTPARHYLLKAESPEHTAVAAQIDCVRATVGAVGSRLSPNKARTAFRALVDIHGVATAVASRLLLAVRPDIFVPVNDGNRAMLRQETGLSFPKTTKQTTKQVSDYVALLKRVQAAPWYDSPPPTDHAELVIWRARAALLDIFVYQSE